jgi:hypothetical protein
MWQSQGDGSSQINSSLYGQQFTQDGAAVGGEIFFGDLNGGGTAAAYRILRAVL